MASLGEELRRQRELRQISLREVSDATKINIRFLEALERNDYTHLPGGQFNKGFIRAYSRHIGVDPEKLVDAYMEDLRKREGPPVQDEQEGRERTGPRPSTVAAAAVIGVLLLAGAGYAAWYFLRVHVPAPAGQRAEESSRSPVVPEAPRSLEAVLRCLQPVVARVECDGRVVYEGPMAIGDIRKVECPGQIGVTVAESLALSVRPAGPPASSIGESVGDSGGTDQSRPAAAGRHPGAGPPGLDEAGESPPAEQTP
jgi:transcriptional regulator with XRE-family HTH domain